jgi:hypothetical protein
LKVQPDDNDLHLAGALGTDPFAGTSLLEPSTETQDESTIDVPSWPEPPGPEAYSGLAGDIVRAIEPHTEADSVALLSQLLVSFGSVVGRGPYFVAGSVRHHTNLFLAIVGVSAKGRKGTAWAAVRQLMQQVDPEWAGKRVLDGLASGEGLTWAVRDPITKKEPIKEKGKPKEWKNVVVDDGVADKRLCVVEGEFARVLNVLARDGNTLSATIRAAWETGDLRTLTKNSPAVATGAHVSIIGHITKDELVRQLGQTEISNGFGNRFLWACARRSKLLPEGGGLSDEDLVPFAHRVREAVSAARRTARMERDPGARELWDQVYRELSADTPGRLSSMTARAEAQTLRLSCLYALLDCSGRVRVEHLQAALALWRYFEASARYVFGDALGDPIAETLLRALRESSGGLTRKEISVVVFQGHASSREILHALTSLLERGLVRFESERTGGRPAQRWFATGVSHEPR